MIIITRPKDAETRTTCYGPPRLSPFLRSRP
jgi:hypothetical protein